MDENHKSALDNEKQHVLRARGWLLIDYSLCYSFGSARNTTCLCQLCLGESAFRGNQPSPTGSHRSEHPWRMAARQFHRPWLSHRPTHGSPSIAQVASNQSTDRNRPIHAPRLATLRLVRSAPLRRSSTRDGRKHLRYARNVPLSRGSQTVNNPPSPRHLTLPCDALLSANKPVNLLVLGRPFTSDDDEGVAQDIASVANLKGRGTYPDDFQHLTEEDWEELEVVLLTTFSNNGVEVCIVATRDLVVLSIFRSSYARLGT